MDELEVRAYKSLGASICIRAIRDYLFLRNAKKESYGEMNLTEIRNFMNSEEFLLYSGGINGHRVLEILDEKLENGDTRSLYNMIMRADKEA